MKKKVIYSILVVLFVAAIIVTVVKGFKVDLYYAEGEVVTVNVGRDIKIFLKDKIFYYKKLKCLKILFQ